MVVKRSTIKTGVKIKDTLPGGKAHPLYGRPILDIIKTGNITQMRKMATTARAHLREVQAALAKLEAQIQKTSAKK